jgi:hypothetical protein
MRRRRFPVLFILAGALVLGGCEEERSEAGDEARLREMRAEIERLIYQRRSDCMVPSPPAVACENGVCKARSN